MPKKIFVTPAPKGIVFFEGTNRKIPVDGAEVLPSFYYTRLEKDGSLNIGVSEKKVSKKASKKKVK